VRGERINSQTEPMRCRAPRESLLSVFAAKTKQFVKHIRTDLEKTAAH